MSDEVYYCIPCKANVEIEKRKKGPHIGAFCKNCGRWIKWISQGRTFVKYVVFNKEGNICGPVGDSPIDVRNAMTTGYRRITGKEADWGTMEKYGYRIERVRVAVEGGPGGEKDDK